MLANSAFIKGLEVKQWGSLRFPQSELASPTRASRNLLHQCDAPFVLRSSAKAALVISKATVQTTVEHYLSAGGERQCEGGRRVDKKRGLY